MNIIRRLRHQFFPLKINDPDFGMLIYMYIPTDPKQSYWEGEWFFSVTGTTVSITLPGDEFGPTIAAKKWYLDLPGRYNDIFYVIKQYLESESCYKKMPITDLSKDIFSIIELSSFNLDSLELNSVEWDISFESLDASKMWFSITVYFVNDNIVNSIVDT